MPIPINNAGLVLLQGYIKPLFSRLELTENDVFVSDSAQRRAVHYLQFLVTGDTQTSERYLTLNKL
ncbi:contractile injection system tape measure protein, partial [Pseudomonas sp.]|uniref:contractile injection system tape measure protein n=1 Tax=Pseudomonas sp. TaxID=306 RepID=UPI0026367829